MNKIMVLVLMIMNTIHLPLANADNGIPEQDLITVRKVDLNHYTGLWYEIARIPNRFQKQCMQNTTAYYSLREDGKIEVINRCLKENGETDEIKGIAKIADTETNAKLKVSFVRFLGISLFWADYWIIDLSEDYQWAVVGTPSRKYGWILARKPELSQEILEHINQSLGEQGYDPTEFIKGQQQSSQSEQ
jgi:apolipoprotein D and lipocalin family protein